MEQSIKLIHSYVHAQVCIHMFKLTIVRNGPLYSAYSTAGGNSSFGSV